jgi:large subunit ribosomal protein L2
MKFLISRIRKQLIVGFSRRSGRNFFGRKTVYTQSGGLKFKKRLIDFKRIVSSNAILLSIEKQLKYSAYLGFICYENGLFSYIMLSVNHNIIGNVISGFSNFFKSGASTFLYNIPAGNFIHHVEIVPGNGAKLARAAGTSCFTISKTTENTFLKMNSG